VSLEVIWAEKAVSQAAGFPGDPGACRRNTVLFPLSAGANVQRPNRYKIPTVLTPARIGPLDGGNSARAPAR
jgi:hypothetical protein